MKQDPPRPQSGSTILVLGDGGWGTALALTLVRAGHRVYLWTHDPDYAEEMRTTRRNDRFLPGVELPPELRVTSRASEAGSGTAAVFSVIPTQFLRATATRLAPALAAFAPVPLVSCSKGVEKGTDSLPSEILRQVLQREHVAVLSGPSHAEEVSRNLPTTVVAASPAPADARLVQDLFVETRLRVYTSQDVKGVELGGAVKNVIAIAAGISDGLGFGDNSRAALITRGLVEATRLGLALGARRETFSGLSGLGDLITTCTSEHSRNRAVGYRIGRGETLDDILRSTRTVAEGVETSRSIHHLGHAVAVEMPISREVFAVLHEGKAPQDAVESLMSRDTKDEMEDLV